MKLFNQLVIMLSIFTGILVSSIMVLNFKSATEFAQNQLYTDSVNTAHWLGLSLSMIPNRSDVATMEAMINAIFDSGYYERIALIDVDGNEIYVRENKLQVHEVPQWFINTVTITNETMSSDIMIEWSRFGSLEVRGHTGHAYRQLYMAMMDLIKTFALISVAGFIVLYILLSISLNALERIRKQAEAVIDNEFIIEEKLPFTSEFRSVMNAMNAMVAKVKDIFDRENETLRHYQELLYKDTETKLYNRRYLVAKLPDYLHADTVLSSGVYAMFSFEGLDRFKKEYGYETYSRFMSGFVDNLDEAFVTFNHALIARLNENDFMVVVPSSLLLDIGKQTEKVMLQIRQSIENVDKKLTNQIVVGCSVGNYTASDTLKTLFSRADHAVTQAKAEENFFTNIDQTDDDTLVLGREEWRNELLESMEDGRLLLGFQPVVESLNGQIRVLHEEVLLRLLDKAGKIHTGGYFLPIAASLGLADTIDRYMIYTVLERLKEQTDPVPLALNLSCDFVKQQSNRDWLFERLDIFHRRKKTVLRFEVTNTVAINESGAVQMLATMLKSFGYRFGIDHFVLPESGADYLQSIRPDYIRSNATYLEDMLYDTDTGNARGSLKNLVQSLGISIIAMNIEEEQQVDELKALGITRFQGTYIAPVELHE